MNKKLLQLEYVNLEVDASSQSELFDLVSEQLKLKGLVTDTYQSALKERENNFPTGLATSKLNIGIPHTDPEHINEAFIYIVRNNSSIEILQMGDNSELACKDFIFLGIKEPSKQVGMLSKLMELFMDDNFSSAYIEANHNEGMFELLTNHF